jgi:hypothetical protein
MRDYSGHFAMIRSARRYRKNLLSWTGITNSDELADQSSKPIKHPEEYRHFGELSSHRFNNQTHKSLVTIHFEFILRIYRKAIIKEYKHEVRAPQLV